MVFGRLGTALLMALIATAGVSSPPVRAQEPRAPSAQGAGQAAEPKPEAAEEPKPGATEEAPAEEPMAEDDDASDEAAEAPKPLVPGLAAAIEAVGASTNAQAAYRACPADVFDTARPFWKRYWDAWIGDFEIGETECAADVEVCRTLCLTLRSGAACFATARVLQDNAGLSNHAAWQALFAESCALGYAGGCTNRAAGVKNGGYEGDPLPDPEEPKTAACLFRSFEAACKADDAWGCTMHGMSLQYGEGVAADKAKAETVFEKSCELDADFAACTMARSQIEELKAPE